MIRLPRIFANQSYGFDHGFMSVVPFPTPAQIPSAARFLVARTGEADHRQLDHGRASGSEPGTPKPRRGNGIGGKVSRAVLFILFFCCFSVYFMFFVFFILCYFFFWGGGYVSGSVQLTH